MQENENVLILTPVKNASEHLDRYCELLERLEHPKQNLALGLLEGDSTDGTYHACRRAIQRLDAKFHRTNLFKKDFRFTIPPQSSRHDSAIQVARRSALAKARNHLLFNALEEADEWVLWIDVDLVDYSADILAQMLRTKKQIVHPECLVPPASVQDHCNRTSYDLNAWSENGTRCMHDLRADGELVPLDAVGGTMLLVNADLHRDGLVFPCFPYGVQSVRIRPRGQNDWYGEIETEGLGIMAGDMGVQCWGMTNVRTIHR